MAKGFWQKNKMDYYQTLGVTKEAEDFVIKAAYKALMRAYHPDRNPGFQERVKLINNAYDVLSDSVKRAEYDAKQADTINESSFEDSPFNDDIENDIDSDWTVIVDYYPEIERTRLKLARYSSSLAISYVLTVIETKNFKTHQDIARSLKDRYLTSYFGSSAAIKSFAEMLLLQKKREPLLDINRAVRVFGSDIDEEVLIKKIRTKFPDIKNEGIATIELISIAKKGTILSTGLVELAKRLEFKSEVKHGFFSSTYKLTNQDGRVWSFKNCNQMSRFLIDEFEKSV